MIRYSLACVADHAFEAWFTNSATFDAQSKKHQVECPVCGSTEVRKQIMAPTVKDSGEKQRSPQAEMAALAGKVRKHIAETHDYVGDKFATEARAMYYGDIEQRPMWGEVTPDVAQELHEEGVPAMPLPKPFAPDPPKKRDELN
jgi:hypothetical protein